MSDYPGNGFRSNPELDGSWGDPAPQAWPEKPDSKQAEPVDYNATIGYDREPSAKAASNIYSGTETTSGSQEGGFPRQRPEGQRQRDYGAAASAASTGADRPGSSVNMGAERSASAAYAGTERPSFDSGAFRNPPLYPEDTLAGGGRGGRDRKEKKSKKEKGSSFGMKLLKTLAIALVFGLVAGAAFSGVNYLTGRSFGGTTKSADGGSDKSGKSGGESGTQDTQVNVTAVDYTEVVENVMPSVVAITGTFTQEGWFGQTYTGEGAGSGFITEITDDEIFIGTNNHVVEGGTNITVLFNDESSAPATVVGTDKDADLAVVSVKKSDVKDETLKAIKTVEFSEEEVKVGQSVIAIGNALGYGQSVTTGVISAKNRRVSFTDGSMTLLQTDAAINPGNSGGILINTSGQVIGINNAKLEDTSVEGMCYAIPVSRAVPILGDLKEAGSMNEDEQAYLGIQGGTVDSSYSELYDIPAGVVVNNVITGSPAEQAGIQTGDIIVNFDGNEISTMEGLQSRIGHKKAGQKVAVTIKRKTGENYKEQELTVTMGKKSDMPEMDQGQEPDSQDPQSGGRDDQYNWDDILPYIFGN